MSKNNYIFKFFYGSFFAIIILLISILLFRGRLGSDDLEVFNFVHGYLNSDFISIKDYAINSQDLGFYYNDVQKHSFLTFYHRFIWVLQTLFSYKLISIFLNLLSIDSIFTVQYFCGLIISIYSILSCYYFYVILKKKNMDHSSSLILSFFLFFGTGLISFFTGSYIESLVVLLLVLRFFYKNIFIIFLMDLIILLIKPYYYIMIFFYKLSDYFFIKKSLNSIIKYLFFLFFVVIIYRFFLAGLSNNLNQLTIHGASYDINLFIKNFINFYFSFGVGIFFTSTIPIILIYFGRIKKVTILKFIGLIFFSIFISMWEGFHGQAPGGRYFLPLLFFFLDEMIIGYKKIITFKRRYYFVLFYLFLSLTIFNLPTLEYRNTSLPEYLNKTIYTGKPAGPVINSSEINTYKIFQFPLRHIEFNNIIFSSKIFIYKFFNKKNIYIANYSIDLADVYPSSGLGRLLYINENNLTHFNFSIFNFTKKFYFLLKIIQIILFLIFLLLIIFCSLNLIKKKELRGKN